MTDADQFNQQMQTGISRGWILLLIFVIALLIRVLTGYFMATNLGNSGWFPYGIYNVFHEQAVAILDGTASPFWIDDPSATSAAIYPPGYSLWLALIYAIGGIRSAYAVQVVQLLLDSVSVLLIVAIGTSAFRWRVGIAAGVLAALSPLLAMYGVMPLADAPTSWLVLGGIWMLIKAAKTKYLGWALGAGIMVGLSCWFRSNGLLLTFFWSGALFLLVRVGWSRRIVLASCVLIGAAVLIAPIVVRNSIAFQAFVPTGLGAGTNLWEGIGETSRAAEFGAIYGDRALLESERIEMGRAGDETVGLYWPDGVRRDRERMRKAMNVIAAHPLWYAGVMLKRMWGHLKYDGRDSGIYGSTGINISPGRSLPSKWKLTPLALPVTIIGWIQVIVRLLLLPLMLAGIYFSFRLDRKMCLLLLSTVAYYLVVGTFMHSEIRYSLPMQALLMVFAGFAISPFFGRLDREANVLISEDNDKIQTREQWSADPCGAVHGREYEYGTREFFDEVERHRYNEYGPWMPEVMEFDKFAGKRLIEVGCGMGTDLLQFARGGAKCTGVDLTPRSVETSRQHFRVYEMHADFSLADAENLPFGDETFDVFYSNGVLHHTPDTAQTIREGHRILKSGGTAKVMLYYRHSWNFWIDLMLKQGIYRREFFRGLSSADIMSKYVEYNEGGGRPLVKVYSKREVRKMFSMFREIKVEIDQLTRPEIYFIGKYIPESLFRVMRRTFGWNVVITAIK